MTFDGTYYSFQGNCSYWLVKEILPKYNFSVMIDNYYCGAADGLSCPQSITVFYKTYKIFITQTEINGTFTNQVLPLNVMIHSLPLSPITHTLIFYWYHESIRELFTKHKTLQIPNMNNIMLSCFRFLLMTSVSVQHTRMATSESPPLGSTQC